MDLTNCLEKLEIFQGLNETQRAALKRCCIEKTYHQGEKLFGENEEATCLWALNEGQVDLRFDLPCRESSQETTIASISEGKSFGWSSMVPPYKYRLSAYCVTKMCQVIQIDRKMMIEFFEGNPGIGYVVMTNLAKIIGTRFHQLQEEMVIREGDDILHRRDF